MKKLLTTIRGIAESFREAQYAPVILLAFVICIWLLPSYNEPPQQDKKLKFELTIPQAEIVLDGLAKLPYEKSAPVIAIIQQQAAAQLQPPAPADTTKPKKNK